MAIVIKEAKTLAELEDVLEIRYNTVIKQGRKVNRLFEVSKKISDHFDAYPRTINVIAYSSGKAVGSIRGVFYNGHDKALNLGFDYSETNEKLATDCYLIDMICIGEPPIDNLFLARELLRDILKIISRNGGQYAFFNASDGLKSTAMDVSFRPLEDGTYNNEFETNLTPMIINLSDFQKKLLEGMSNKDIMRFQNTFYQVIFSAGEIMVVEGERGSTAFIIEDGEVEVLIKKNDEVALVRNLGRGNIIGEMAMVTNERRTASIMAATTCSCIAFDRSSFMDAMKNDPGRMLDMFKIFSSRVKQTTQAIVELKNKYEGNA